MGHGSCAAAELNQQIAIVDNVSLGTTLGVPVLLCVSFYLIPVPKVLDMIIGLCMCKGAMGHANVLDSKSDWLMFSELDIVLPVTVK